MKNALKKDWGHLPAGYRVLDVKYASVDENAVDDVDSEPAATFPRTTPAAVPPTAPIVLNRGRCAPPSYPTPIRCVKSIPTQRRFGRRKRAVWLRDLVRAERVPLMLALTGIATSAFLAMLCSMFESRVSAALSVRDNGSFAAVILAWKPFIVLFPAAIGVGILCASWLGRIARTCRTAPPLAASARRENIGTGPALQGKAPLSSRVETAAEPRQQQPPITPEQSRLRRAA